MTHRLELPDWAVLHLPHDSTEVPDCVRGQFALSDADLADELLKMTDHHTGDLFSALFAPKRVIRAPVSRLVVDVERFEDDALEPMAAQGMGAVYRAAHNLGSLRDVISNAQREALMEAYYRPHHLALSEAVASALTEHNRALVLDAHSFPSKPLPYELNQAPDRPQICVGTDEFHTPDLLLKCIAEAFEATGFTVGINAPFFGTMVPKTFYQQAARVSSVMIEVRRDVYMDEQTGAKLAQFDLVCDQIQSALAVAINRFSGSVC